jgi:hypothetical protein
VVAAEAIEDEHRCGDEHSKTFMDGFTGAELPDGFGIGNPVTGTHSLPN